MAKATKASAKLADQRRCECVIRHEFEIDEWKEKSTKAAQKAKQVELKEEAVKAASSVAKSEIKRLKAELNDELNALRNGYDERTVQATVEFNSKKGTKRFYHFAPGKPENKSFIREEAMVEDDFKAVEGELELVDPKTQPPPETVAKAIQTELEKNQIEDPPRVKSADADPGF